MAELPENNKVNEETQEDLQFKYNFVNMPWDDRTRNSKIGIVALLVAIFIGILACVINSIVIHYKGFRVGIDYNCPIVKMEDYEFVARVVSIGAEDLLCVGAVISRSTVLVSKLCIKSGPVRLHLGVPKDPICRKGFSVDIIEAIPRDANEKDQTLLLLTSKEDLTECANIIEVGHSLDTNSPVFVVGRAYFSEKSLLYRAAKVVKIDKCSESAIRQNASKSSSSDIICVMDIHTCPVREGDMLIQNKRLYGIATNSTNNPVDNYVSFSYIRDISKLAFMLFPG